MKILVDGIVFSHQRMGGISRVFQETLPRMLRLDRSLCVDLYIRRKLRNEGIRRLPGVRYVDEPSIYPWRWIWDKARVQAYWLDRTCRKRQPDIFHSTYFTLPRNPAARTVVSVYDMMDEIYARLIPRRSRFQLLDRKQHCIARADLVVSISRHTTQDILKFYPINPEKIVTIPLGVGPEFRRMEDIDELDRFRERHGLRRPYFLYVGNRRHIKNFMTLLQAYADFSPKREVDLVVVGGEAAWTTEERALLQRRNLTECVKHLPQLIDKDLVSAYSAAFAFIYPSLYEGFGLPVLEAMACGTPVLTSNVASLPEVAGDAALFFRPEDPNDIARVLREVLNPDVRTSLIKIGYTRAAQFSWDTTAQGMLNAYRGLLQ